MPAHESPLFRLPRGVQSRCSNVHNVTGAKGQAGVESRFPLLAPGETLDVTTIDGPGIITRLWLTFQWPRHAPFAESARRNRSVVLEISWDDAQTPAIEVPVGDFFCHPLGYDLAFENAFFGSPVGRSLLCHIPMPFHGRARIRVRNEFDQAVSVFHDIRYLQGVTLSEDDGYLHACFRRTIPTAPGLVHEILPRVHGRGRFLGAHVNLMTDRFNPLHWHNIHPLYYLDGDREHPSLMGASLDDIAGASWAYNLPYVQRDSGLLLSRSFDLGGGHFGFYWYHRRDPMVFAEDFAATLRPKTDANGQMLLETLGEFPGLAERLTLPEPLETVAARLDAGEDVWYECGRLDDVSSVALYYLDRPNGDHAIPDLATRCAPAWQWPPPDADRLLPDG